MLRSFLSGEFLSVIHPVLVLFLSREFLLHIPCCLHFYAGSFSYTSQAAFIFTWGVSLTHPLLAPFYVGSFSSTSRADFFFMWGVSLTHPVLDFDVRSFFAPVLPSILSREFLLHTLCWLRFFIWGISLKLHIPSWFLFLSREFLLHIPSWLHFYRGSFSYTSQVGFIFIQCVSLTHSVLASLLSGEFFLHILCRL